MVLTLFRKILIFLLILAVCMGVASASQDVNDTAVLAEDSTSLPIEDSNMQQDLLQLSDEDDLSDENGEFVDPSEAYDALNRFRCEEGVWQWNEDDATKTCFNTDDAVWLKPLERDAELEETAKIRAMELYKRYSHYRPDGTICFTIFPEGLLAHGENIAVGGTSAEEVTEDWKEVNDPYDGQGHRRNMINPDFNCVGIAGYRINGVVYWVQDFGCRFNPKSFDDDNAFHVEQNNSGTPKFSVELPIYATGVFIVKVNGREVLEKSIFQGNASAVLYGLDAGLYDVELIYSGDNNYRSINQTCSVNATGDDSPTASFAYLNTLIKMAGDEITLQKDYSYDEAMDADFKGGIIIPERMTIDGAGHRIDAGGQARIFQIVNGTTLKNLKLANGYSAYYGGAVLSIYTVFLENCTFTNSSADMYGGAIYSCNQIRCYNSKFIDNTARINGGALFGEAAVIVDDSSFINNQALNLGGAIYAQGTISSDNSDYVNNTNLQVYSLMKIIGNGNDLEDEYSMAFANATQDNGVVNLNRDWIATQTIRIDASNVVINGNGHSINAQNRTRIFFITGNNVTIRNITLSGGRSIGEGGAIFFGSSGISIIASNFTGNWAETGAAIFASGNVFIQSSGFTDNTAEAGGAIFSDEGNITVTDSVFTNNDASYGGGAIYTTAKVDITSSLFAGNDVEKYGGAIFTNGKDLGKVSIRNSIFTNNTSKLHGGVFVSTLGAEIYESTFTNNSGGERGGVMCVYGGKVMIENSNFANNTASESGGAVHGVNVEVRGSNFTNNVGANARTFSSMVIGTASKVMENGEDVTSSCIRPPSNQNGSGSKTPSEEPKKIVKKASKIVAAKKTFRVKLKTKKYLITLKSGKNPIKKVKVFLKVNKKTYKATTNSKGKAVFKIKKLSKKGKFKATITFKGNKYYMPSSKKVKITVR